MGYFASNEEKKRFTKFTKELATLSKKHGIVLEVTGGVNFVDLKEDKESLEKLSYTDDAVSGDINPLNFFEEEEPVKFGKLRITK